MSENNSKLKELLPKFKSKEEIVHHEYSFNIQTASNEYFHEKLRAFVEDIKANYMAVLLM